MAADEPGDAAPPANNTSPPPADNQSLGKAPEDNSQWFLRGETVLLKEGQWEMDYGFEYTWFEQKLPVAATPLVERYRQREWFVPTALRYGLTDNLQPYVNIPWGGTESDLSDFNQEQGVSKFGLGDISAGLTYLCPEKYCGNTNMVVGLGFSAPTGIAPFSIDPINASLGSGFWQSTVNVNFITAVDPAVWFWGVGYTHEFAAEHVGQEFQPGEILFYQFGVGYAINDCITLSSTFRGQFQGEWKANGTTLPGSSLEPFTLRFAATSTVWTNQICEPFVQLGLDSDAPQVDFGILWTHRF
jgi:hypothetical protein